SYYGLRALVVLYMTGEIMQMDRSKALFVYGWFGTSLLFSQIIGGLIGDFALGNRKTLILGNILQALGAFCLCIPSSIGLYLGLFFVALGYGLYTPNIIAMFGKLYSSKTKLIDSGFTIFYFAVNLGSFVGILIIGLVGHKFGDGIGFILSGMLMLLSIIPLLFSNEEFHSETNTSQLSLSNSIRNISIVFLAIGLFWGIHEISNIRIFDLELKFSEMAALTIPQDLWQALSSIIFLPVCLIAFFYWSYYYSSLTSKLLLGFIFGIISYGLLFLIPEIPVEKHALIYLISLISLAISETHLAPVLYSSLTKYANQKYLTTLISLAFIPPKAFNLIFGIFNDTFYNNPLSGLKFGITAMTIASIGLILYIIWEERKHGEYLKNKN
nr:MFS transporter [Saprospiraceae bacterium]